MLSGRVVGTIVSTRKLESLVGSKFLEVRLVKNGRDTDEYIVAIDTVGAGIGEKVLITTGSGARLALARETIPSDAAIVGIID
ncbi:MAG TPA: ethanolamine utilization protein EutN [Ruminococcaceae bacterium]|jgi:ethanolamine utilization protein EutN|nr:ethanolamine utilization protein EutN [Oscillospiraceae bacterium]HBQ46043.1 ethanolamine utilization protein EutN [Oscillospiraceae bacterium]